MNHHSTPEDLDSVYLKVIIIEPILLACIDGSTFSEIQTTLQRVIPTSNLGLREYIYYLIDNSFISYDGLKKAYFIEPGGLDLLGLIYIPVTRRIVDYVDLTVKVG